MFNRSDVSSNVGTPPTTNSDNAIAIHIQQRSETSSKHHTHTPPLDILEEEQVQAIFPPSRPKPKAKGD